MYRKSTYHCWLTAAFSALILMVALTFSGSVITIYTGVIADDLGMSRATLSVLNTLRTLTASVLDLQFYRLLRRFSLKSLVLCGLMLNVAMLNLFSVSHSFPAICLVGIIGGFTSAFNGVISVSLLVRNWFQKSQGVVMAAVMAFNGIGSAVVNPILSLLVSSHGWRVGFRSLSAVTLLLAVLSALFLHAQPQDIGLLPYGAVGTAVAEEEAPRKGRRPLHLFGNSLEARNLRALAFISALFSLSELAVYNNLGPVILELGFTPIFALGTAISCAALSNCVGKLAMGKVNDRFGTAVMLKLWYGLCPVAVLSVILLQLYVHVWPALLCTILIGWPAGIYTVSVPLVCSRLFPDKGIYVFATSVCVAATNLAIAISNPLFHIFYDLSGTYIGALLMALLLTLLCFLMVLRIISKNQLIFRRKNSGESRSTA